MKSMTGKQWKQFIQQWKTAGTALEKVRRDELRMLKYNSATADALLDIGDRFGRSRKTSGMVEMQKWFMKLAEQQGLRTRAVREKTARYRAQRVSPPRRGRGKVKP